MIDEMVWRACLFSESFYSSLLLPAHEKVIFTTARAPSPLTGVQGKT